MPEDKQPAERPPGEARKEDTETYHDFTKDFSSGSSLTPRYKILKLIGAGGMGRVYLAHDLDLNTDVALKIIRPELVEDEKILDRFRNELLLARKVSHRNVVRIHDIGETNGLKYLSMTYVEGRSLRDILRSEGPMSVDRALNIITQISEGIAAAHDEGVIHRDLKPSNILLDANDRVYIADFGIARSLESDDLTATGSIVGTPAYFSPEQSRGEQPGIASDVYAIGLIFYEMLTGELPYDRQTVDRFRTKGGSDLENRLKSKTEQVPDYIVSVIKKCLDPHKEFRYRDLRALLEDLRQKQVRRSFVALLPPRSIVAATIVILLLAGGIYFWQQTKNKGPAPPPSPTKIQTSAALQSVAILPFANQTGKMEYDWVKSGLADMLITDLSQTGNLRVISSDRIFQTLQDLKITEGSPEERRKLAEILDADLVIDGSLIQAGSTLRADLKLMDVTNPSASVYFKATGNKQEDLFPMLDNLTHQIQNHLKSGSTTVSRSPQVSISALKAYNLGMDSFRSGDFTQASERFENSIRDAPKFAPSYLKLSQTYEQLNEFEKATAILEQGLQKIDPQDMRSSLMIRSRLAVMQDDLDKAIDLYQQTYKKYPNDPDVLYDLAIAYEQKGDLTNAIATLEKVVQYDANHPDAYFHLGKDTILMGDAEKAINRYLIRAQSITTQLNNEFGQADVLNAIGVAYERLGRYDDAVKYYNDSIAIKEKVGNQKGVATSLNNIAKIYVFQGEHEKAQTILKRTLAILEKIHDQQGIAGAMNMFGVIYEDQGRYDQALDYYKKALQIRKELGNDQLTAQSYDNIGQIYYLLTQYDNAQVYWEQALALRKSIGEQSGVILSLQNIGSLQLAQGKLDQATKSFLDALNQSRAIKYENAIAVSLGNLGTIYQRQGRYSAALDSYKEALEVVQRLKDKKGMAEYTKWIGSALLELHDFGPAEEKLKEAIQYAEESGSSEIATELRVLLGRLYRMQQNLDEARKQIDSAVTTASQQNYQKTLLYAKIEKGLLSARQTDLQEVLKQSKDLNDQWIILGANEALATLLMKDHPATAIERCEEAILIAEKMGLVPALFRLHQLEGEAYSNMSNSVKASEHFHQSSGYLEQLKKANRPEHISKLK